MTKKDYEAIANVINNETTQDVYPYDVKTGIVEGLCLVFEKDNPLFKADKFREACLEGKHICTSIKEAV